MRIADQPERQNGGLDGVEAERELPWTRELAQDGAGGGFREGEGEPGFFFWPDDVAFAQAVAFTGIRLMGHQQVTDAYLLGLAIRRGGVLATLDERIAALTEPKSVEGKALEVVA